MAFIDDLLNGRPGLKLAIPPEWKVHEDHPRRAVLIDNEHKVGWHLAHAPVQMDLRPEHDEVLRRDISRHARYAFAEQYKQVQVPPEVAAQRKPARTSDPAWSPVIAIERVKLSGGEGLWILRRMAYEAGLEVVLSTFLVPLQSGLMELTAFHRTGECGLREEALVTEALTQAQHQGKTPEAVAAALGQAYFDDEKHDEQFPLSPVALARRAGRWLLSDPARLQVTGPVSHGAPGEVELPGSECIIVPPPRYLPLSAQGLGVPATMSVLTRAILDATDNPRVLDVWLLPDLMAADNRENRILDLARRATADWERQGATEIEANVRALPKQGEQLRAACTVRMRLGDGRVQSVMRWMVEPDGRVFRVAIGAPLYVELDELEAEADQVMATFRRRPRQLRNAWLTSDLRLRPPEAPKPSA